MNKFSSSFISVTLKLFSFYSDEKRGWFTSSMKEKVTQSTQSSRITTHSSRVTSRTTTRSAVGSMRSAVAVRRSSVSMKVTRPPKKSIWDLFTGEENRDETTTSTMSTMNKKNAIIRREGITSERSFTMQETSVEVTTRDVS